MQRAGSSTVLLFRIAEALDAWMLAVPRWAQRVATALTFLVIGAVGIQNVPRAYIDFQTIPALRHVPQRYDAYGTDTIADMYEARVVLNDVGDMYTKRLVEQSEVEARAWSKEASAPYPPATLLAEAALYTIGEWTGVGFYGMILALAILFLASSAQYSLRTRWYTFPVLYLNFSYIGQRFVYVQDGSYLLMLAVVMAALWAARGRRPSAHALMALAVAFKLSPLYYLKNVTAMPRGHAGLFVAILAAGLLLPYFVWDDYLSIYAFHDLRGGSSETVAAVLVAVPFALVVWYVETRLGFDMEDRVGWGLVPFALFLGLKMNSARHLLMVLLVPDKRALRNVAAGVGLLLPALAPGLIRQNSALLISTGVLVVGLAYYLSLIGWEVIRADVRQPGKTWRMMIGRTAEGNLS